MRDPYFYQWEVDQDAELRTRDVARVTAHLADDSLPTLSYHEPTAVVALDRRGNSAHNELMRFRTQ